MSAADIRRIALLKKWDAEMAQKSMTNADKERADFEEWRAELLDLIFHYANGAMLNGKTELKRHIARIERQIDAVPCAGREAERAEAVTDVHPDDLAVDRFAAAMKAKLAQKRAEGRGGWDDPAQCSGEYLSLLLVEHIEKGDPLDVDNLAILLASFFEPGIDDDKLDDSGTWKQGAIDAANQMLDAIHAHYADRIEKLEAAFKWVGEVYPDTLPSRGARVEMTWDEFNAMREVMGLPLRKPKPRARAALNGDSK